MKVVSFKSLADEKAIVEALKKLGLSINYLRSVKNNLQHGENHEEDCILISEKYPIFAVADGITLIQYIIEEKPYPIPSPAFDVAKIFCETAIKFAEEKYQTFSLEDIKTCFQIANQKIKEYNEVNGRTKETIDYWEKDYYACTAGLLVIKEQRAYWGTICDSYLMQFDCKGILKFTSPHCRIYHRESEIPEFVGNNEKEKRIYRWSKLRNAVNQKGEPVGYGVLTGEETALLYVNRGELELKENDILCLLTDGFLEYLKLKEFINIFVSWPENINKEAEKFMEEKINEIPTKFGLERSLIVVKI